MPKSEMTNAFATAKTLWTRISCIRSSVDLLGLSTYELPLALPIAKQQVNDRLVKSTLVLIIILERNQENGWIWEVGESMCLRITER